MHLMYVFILQKNNQTSKKCFCKFGQMILYPPVYMHKVRMGFGFTLIGLCHEIVPFVYLCIKFHIQ